ncbi:MAG: CDP-alcohol phosphatidyltransferase family protein, partial [Acetobacteraceae bacterium]
GQEVTIRPLFVSKANTAMQIVLAAFVLLNAAYGLPGDAVVAVLIWLTAATTLASGAAYVARWVRGGGASGE